MLEKGVVWECGVLKRSVVVAKYAVVWWYDVVVGVLVGCVEKRCDGVVMCVKKGCCVLCWWDVLEKDVVVSGCGGVGAWCGMV